MVQMGKNKLRPFSMRDKMGYMFGDFGNDFTFILSTTALMKFYTDVVGISAGIVGTIMMIARFVDAFTDITMGRICDRSKGNASGKFKPWLLRMCGPVAIASFLMYQGSLSNAPQTVKVIYLFVTYILWGSVFYTSINIPYGSMASAISADAGDRQSLSTFRTMGGTLAGAFIGIVFPLVAFTEVEGQQVLNGNRVTLIAGICSVLAVVCYLVCYMLCTERVRPEVTEDVFKSNSVGKMLVNAVKNRALISIIAASVVMLLAQLTMQNMASYVFPDYYNNAGAQSVATMAMIIAMVLAAFVSKPLVRKFGKAEVSIVSSLFAGVVCIVMLVLRPENVWIYVALQAFCWLGLGLFSMVSWALITDVIDYSEIKNGIREDGSVYALYSFARKLGQALASGVAGWLLSAIGYNENAIKEGITQTPEVLSGIYSISTIVPAVGFILLGLILWFWYPLKKKTVENNIKLLKEKHESE